MTPRRPGSAWNRPLLPSHGPSPPTPYQDPFQMVQAPGGGGAVRWCGIGVGGRRTSLRSFSQTERQALGRPEHLPGLAPGSRFLHRGGLRRRAERNGGEWAPWGRIGKGQQGSHSERAGYSAALPAWRKLVYLLGDVCGLGLSRVQALASLCAPKSNREV